MNVAAWVLSRGGDTAPAILARDRVVDFLQLRFKVTQTAQALLTGGYRLGDKIGIWSENNPFFIFAYLGIIRAGMVAVPLPPELEEEQISEIGRAAGLEALFVSRRQLKRAQAWASDSGKKLLVEDQWPDESAPSPGTLCAEEPPGGLAAVMFTSGSTGAPKGVMVSHRNIRCNTADILGYLKLSPADRAMVVLPLHYCFGASLLHTLMAAGGSVVLSNDFRLYPELVLQQMNEHGCTGLAGVPSTYQLLLRKSRFARTRFSTLRWFQQAGGKLPESCVSEITQAFPGVRFYAMYGQTEATARLSYLPPERLADKAGSIGRGLASTRLEVLRADGSRVVPGSDEVGEIVASGGNITQGYWNDPAETAKYFRGGRLFTGDLARVDADGFIFIVEREREIIKSGGNRVSAKEVEEVIAELKEVVEVAVVGAPHEWLGESIEAVVVPRTEGALSSTAVIAHCRTRLPAFKTPQFVTLVQSMPHNAAGKILKPRLKELLRVRAGEEGLCARVSFD